MSIIKKVDGRDIEFANKKLIDHNQLANRNAYGAHNISAIRNLPEKLFELKGKDSQLSSRLDELNKKIDDLHLEDVKNELTQLDGKIDSVKSDTQKIDIVENADSTFTFTNYGGAESKTIQSGFLPDDDSIQLSNKKLALKKVYTYPQFIGSGTKDDPISILTDPQTIVPNNDNVLQAIGVHVGVDGVLLSGESIQNEFTELNKDIGDLTQQLNDDVDSLETWNHKQDNQLSDLMSRTKGLGGYLDATNLGENPTQDKITEYALAQIGQTDRLKIFNQTKVKNLYDGNIWILTNTPDSEPPVFSWANVGQEKIADANNDGVHGLVTGSNEKYEGSIDLLGHISINGLDELDTKVTNLETDLSDKASLTEQNNFTGINNFHAETIFESNIEASGNLTVNSGSVKFINATKDKVTQINSDGINIDQDSNNGYSLQFPSKSGTLATTSDIDSKVGFKHSQLINNDSETDKEDAWTTNELDATLVMSHQNGKSFSNVSVSKDYSEITTFKLDAETGILRDFTIISAGDGTAKIDVQNAAGDKKQLSITSDAVKINDDIVATSADLVNYVPIQSEHDNDYYSQVTNENGQLSVNIIGKDTQTDLHTLIINNVGAKLDSKELATKDETIADGNLVNWNAAKNTLVDSGRKASDLDGKLNKLAADEVNRVYVRKTDNEDSSLPYTYTAEANSIALRSAAGTLSVETPTQDNDAANKAYVESQLNGKIDKITTTGSKLVYGVNAQGEQYTYTLSDVVSNDSIPVRTVAGALKSTAIADIDIEELTDDTVATRKDLKTKAETSALTSLTAVVNNKQDKQKYIELSDESGTLTDEEFQTIQTDKTVMIIRSGVYYRLQSEPLNGSGNYSFISDFYSTGDTEVFAAYIITIKPDKTWSWKLKNFSSNPAAVLYTTQALTQEQKDQACANIGVNNKAYIELTDIPESATQGTITDEQLQILQSSNSSYILLNNEKYDLQDIQTAKGYLIFTHKGEDNTDKMFTKCIAVTLSTKAWKLKVQGTDEAPTENSSNLITSGAVYAANQLKADANAGNIDYTSFAEKLNIKQSTETTSDGSTVIRFGNLMFIYKAFLIAGNTEQVYTFPYQFDNGSPMCWCNNTASGASANNSCAVTESSSLSMKVRVCGVESSVTLFAIGWKAN